MNLDIKRLFPKPKPPIAVQALRGMVIRDASGVTRTVEPGDEFQIHQSAIADYDANDLRVMGGNEPKIAYTDPTPIRAEPTPAPPSWEKLPACFVEYWQISEKLRVARDHLHAIRQTFHDLFLDGLQADGSPSLALRFTAGKPNEGVTYLRREFSGSEPEARAQHAYLTASEQAAEDYLTRLKETSDLKLQELFLQCSSARLKAADRLTELVSELGVVGFAIFEIRLQALGLADTHLRRLYAGSADYERFGRFAGPCMSDACILRLDETGQPHIYFDCSVTSTACHHESDLKRIEEITPILAAAQKELTAARRVIAKAA